MGPERMIEPKSYAVICDAAAAVCGLPAVATLDWCDGAASALTHLASPALTGVLIGTLEADGTLGQIEAAGVAGRAEAYPSAGAGFGSAHAAVELSTKDARLTGLRARLERLGTLGWAVGPEVVRHGAAAPMSRLAGEGWRHTAAGKVWGDLEPETVLAGIRPIGTVEPGRAVIAMMAVPETSPAKVESLSAMLGAVLGLVEKRAVMAIGSKRASSTQWLTGREQIVLEQLSLGKSVRQIAEELDRSPHTVHDHVKSLHRKLDASSRGELIARALGHIQPAAATEASGPEVVTTPGVGTKATAIRSSDA